MSVFGGYKTASLTVTVDVEPFGVSPTQPEGPLPSTLHPESFKSLHPSASRKFIRRSARKKLCLVLPSHSPFLACKEMGQTGII